MAQHLYPTMWKHTASEGICTYIRPCVNTSHQKGSALTSDHVRTHCVGRALHLHPTMFKNTALEGLHTYIWPCLKTLHQKGSALTFDHVWTHCIKRPLSPRLRIPGNWPGASIILKNGINPYIWSSGKTSLNHIRMALHLYMIMWDSIPQSYQNGPQSHTEYSW